MGEEKVRKEGFKFSGEKLVATIKKLVKKGNIRRITIKNKEGKTLIEIPLTLGVWEHYSCRLSRPLVPSPHSSLSAPSSWRRLKSEA